MKDAHIEYNLGRAYYSRSASPTNLIDPVSKSLLWEFNQSPYKWRHGAGKEATKAMELGTLIHAAILEPNQSLDEIAAISPYSDFRSNAAKEWRDEQRQRGKMIATEEDMRIAMGCEAVFAEDYAERFKGDYKTEVAVFATIGATKIKGMIDLVPDNLDCLVDLKTTTTKIGSLRNIINMIVDRGYHWQAALYLDLWNAASGENRTRFIFCFIEVEQPHETAWIEINSDFIDAGRIGYMNALAKWQSCCATDYWPRQHDGIINIEKPAYI